MGLNLLPHQFQLVLGPLTQGVDFLHTLTVSNLTLPATASARMQLRTSLGDTVVDELGTDNQRIRIAGQTITLLFPGEASRAYNVTPDVMTPVERRTPKSTPWPPLLLDRFRDASGALRPRVGFMLHGTLIVSDGGADLFMMQILTLWDGGYTR